MTQRQLILYSTEGCHLCEHAEAILDALSVSYEVVDIATTDALIERYGVRIPVLVTASARELGWPFDATAVKNFLALSV